MHRVEEDLICRVTLNKGAGILAGSAALSFSLADRIRQICSPGAGGPYDAGFDVPTSFEVSHYETPKPGFSVMGEGTGTGARVDQDVHEAAGLA